MDTFLDAAWPDPNQGVFEWDAWHPPDFRRPTFANHAAGPTHCRIEWLVFDPNTPAGNESEDTWASVEQAYWMLPHPLAAETMILAHVALAHRIVENTANVLYPLAMHMEAKGNTSIAPDWFSMALLKMLQVVVGDCKRKSRHNHATRGLRRAGEKHGWDCWDVDVPKQIGKYLGGAIKYHLWQEFKQHQRARKHVVTYLLRRHPDRKAGRVAKGEIDQQEIINSDSGPCVAFHTETPDRIVAEKEALDAACGDIFDRLLLLMKRDGATETQIGEELAMSRDQVQRRLQDIRDAIQGDLELPRNGQSKRAPKKPLPVLSATEALLDSPDGDLFDRLLIQVRKGLLAEVQMAARLGWTRDQLQRRLHAMREANRRCPEKHDLLDALIGVAG